MALLFRFFIFGLIIYGILVLIRSLIPEDPGRFSNFDPKDKDSKKKGSTGQNANSGPSLLGHRFPTSQMRPEQILGLQHPIDSKKIQAAYKQKMREFHPDRYVNEPEGIQKLAAESSVLINQARDALMAKFGQ